MEVILEVGEIDVVLVGRDQFVDEAVPNLVLRIGVLFFKKLHFHLIDA